MHKNQKITLAVFVGFAIFAGLAWKARPTPNTQNAELPLVADIGLKAEENNYDFGTISMAEGLVAHRFKIRNTSGTLLQINRMSTSCMCTEATLFLNDVKFGPMGMPGHKPLSKFKADIQSGKEAEIEVVFDPTAHGPAGIGRIERTVYLESNGQTILELGIIAFVKP